jgi:N-succinyl-L-ornithine transcarbamylase
MTINDNRMTINDNGEADNLIHEMPLCCIITSTFKNVYLYKRNNMRHFTSVNDVPDLKKALEVAFDVKKNPFSYSHIGKNKTMVLIFFNSSLRTRLSTQKAAMNLGMNTMVLNVNEDGWQLETEMGVVMDGNKPEHLKEAVPVIGSYCDIIGVRSFARFENRDDDYHEKILNQFIDYAGVPIVSMEAATRHPLQSFADLMTIEEFKTKERPKVVLTWAPHPRALPQAVPNSFVEWMRKAEFGIVVTHPHGYELAPEFMGDLEVEYDQKKAFEGADFIYAKNWASYTSYGQILSKDITWTVDACKMALTNRAKFMHCLPVRRNMIVTDEVIDSSDSIVIREAANREWSAMAVLKMLLEDNY